ncbi:enoyl-CoA hydratase/isomerase family protein [Bradyrhizobium sp. LHD-71]|uniref:enoyl-CoA hydratase/isomerase family protein n=1 Tax=Bradyrhizobium sp. LHD-71 TaxID=3072141 RepID=UPI00280EC631|nr:enoyl-CoA hydratase/isomerase family protein [Bradyrhizobium sp. LHD-71]MDQ8728926.1 enoyl-CoA hydratase/isomerase family protein [Bradyrhizobium sp. LHD-71]
MAATDQHMNDRPADPIAALRQAAAGLDLPVDRWRGAEPASVTDFASDRRLCSEFWHLSHDIIARLPPKPARTAEQAKAAELVHERARRARGRFLEAHVGELYASLTHNLSQFLRVEELVHTAAELCPGLTPTREQVLREEALFQRDKEGHEIDQGIFLSHVLGDEAAGRHLCHAMLLPRIDVSEHLSRFATEGKLDLGPIMLSRQGKAIHLVMNNPRYLNAEDQTTIDAMETAVDIATLDPTTEIAVLRGGLVEHPKYAGKRILGSGINLTHLYRGKIPYLWYMQRELGFVHKFFRGVARREALPDDVHGHGIEKPWIAAVESFAIGGHCQILLTMDYVIAADDAYMTLPARKEGIIPGASNMRLPRFTGDRIARQAIQYGRRLDCDSAEGRLICDEIVPAGEMDEAVGRVVEGLTSSGAVGAIGNRQAFRVAQEPLDMLRRYCAVYAREQAHCHFSPALIGNLEQYWDAQNRKG